jgi:hypothetical protein
MKRSRLAVSVVSEAGRHAFVGGVDALAWTKPSGHRPMPAWKKVVLSRRRSGVVIDPLQGGQPAMLLFHLQGIGRGARQPYGHGIAEMERPVVPAARFNRPDRKILPLGNRAATNRLTSAASMFGLLSSMDRS